MILQENQFKFSDGVNGSIKTLIDLIDKSSGLSDINYLLHNSGTNLPYIKLPEKERSWIPVRNVARILGFISSLEIDGEIDEISIESMSCGCDYFEGILSFTSNGEEIRGPYKWQWTAFPHGERSFAQFTVFPRINESLVREII